MIFHLGEFNYLISFQDADLSRVFCAKDAASVIKSYSPELIVHPVLGVFLFGSADPFQSANFIIEWDDSFHRSAFSGMRTNYPHWERFWQRLISGWKDLTVLLFVAALEVTHFFWFVFLES
jgi:NAD(P)H-hydrate repair Nnr-like enzyme with NAD(P)H-hydrate dehydratase domain